MCFKQRLSTPLLTYILLLSAIVDTGLLLPTRKSLINTSMTLVVCPRWTLSCF